MEKNTQPGTIGFLGALFLVLLVLKVAKVGAVATWSWWTVTAPLWGPTAVVLAALSVVAVLTVVGNTMKSLNKK